MTFSFSRSSSGMLANWWWTVDKLLLFAVTFLLLCGIVLSMSASPAVAKLKNLASYHFVYKQAIFMCIAVGIVLFFSMLGMKWTRRLAILGYAGAVFLLILTIFFGVDIKGARRWLDVGMRIQPSEFIKPVFVVLTAWMFEVQRRYKNFPGLWVSLGLLGLTCSLLLKQPDYGMAIVVVVVWLAQVFLSGVSIRIFVVLGMLALVLFGMAYLALPHVQVRIDGLISGIFADKPQEQVRRSLDAFENGGFFGVGVGEGVVKWHIPDAHTDFIFPVAAEEYGMFVCLLIVLAYATVVVRSMWLSSRENNMFIVLSVCGLAISFGIQALVNMASTMQLGPTKGMALPLISYGGSSLMGSAIGVGMLLALTRKNVYAENRDDEG